MREDKAEGDGETREKTLSDLAQEEEDANQDEWARIDKSELRRYYDDSEPTTKITDNV